MLLTDTGLLLLRTILWLPLRMASIGLPLLSVAVLLALCGPRSGLLDTATMVGLLAATLLANIMLQRLRPMLTR